MFSSNKKLQEEGGRQIRFLITAIAAYVLYLVVYRIFRGVVPFSQPLLLFILAVLAGDFLNYMGSRYWVFRRTEEALSRQGGKFFLVMFLTFVLQSLLFWMGRRWTSIPELFLLAFLPGVRMAANYLLHRSFTFVAPSSPRNGSAIY